MLRILLAVNAAAAVAALASEPHWSAFGRASVATAAYVEPYVLTELLLLYALAPWLARLPGSLATWVVMGITVLVGLVVYTAIGQLVPVPAGDLLRYLLFALLLTGVLIRYFRLRAKALSPAIAEARLQALQARIRPHFLFNSINAVLSLVRSEPQRAEVALEDMADLFRVLMRDNRELAPLGDEVHLCQQYLELEKLRLGERLVVDWHLKSMPADALVPPLVLQPILENAVYHGIEPCSEPGVVSINIFLRAGDVHMIVRNPYRVTGGSHHAGNKMALGNVRERLALHFDVQASLTSRVAADAYEVHIRMPYRPTSTRMLARDPRIERRAVPRSPIARFVAAFRQAGAHHA